MRFRLSDQVNESRLWQRHMDLAQIGATAGGGVDRQALTDAELAAWRLLCGWAQSRGLPVFTDPLGNLFVRLPGRVPGLAPVMTGSHLDTQPTGGRFDGVYGVLAGFEVLEAYLDAGVQPYRDIEVVSWMNEEGARFAPGMMGSAGFCGSRRVQDIRDVTDSGGTSVGQALDRLAVFMGDVPRLNLGRPVHCFIEAHIEQGPVLEAAGVPIGVVSGMQGKRTFRVTIRGEAAHAGTASNRLRRDALKSATSLLQALYALCEDDDDLVRFTVGRFQVEPGAPSVVPSRVVFSIDLRHPDTGRLMELGDLLVSTCRRGAARCEVDVEELSCASGLSFSERIQSDIESIADGLGLGHMRLLSSAGHDARHLHQVCETGMIFVPCLGGISHHEAESATSSDLAAGTRVLADLIWLRASI
jgi:N-carbamoyl-L-amino-acid hydrolase